MDIKSKLLKLLALVLFFVALFAGFYAYAVYQENVAVKAQSVELTKKVEELEKEVENYKTKLNTISDILNTALDTDGEEVKPEEDKKEITELKGKYQFNEEGSEVLTYTFEGKEVTYSANHTQKGTYVIEGDKVKITYTEGTDPEGNALTVDKLPDGETDELTIIDEATLKMNEAEFKKVEE